MGVRHQKSNLLVAALGLSDDPCWKNKVIIKFWVQISALSQLQMLQT